MAFLYAPFVFIAGSNLFNATQQLYEAPDWVINIARPINAVIALLCIVYLFIVERKILTKSAVRDLLRRRLLFVRHRTSHILSLQSMITRNLGFKISKRNRKNYLASFFQCLRQNTNHWCLGIDARYKT